jgi:hypothetical protein
LCHLYPASRATQEYTMSFGVQKTSLHNKKGAACSPRPFRHLDRFAPVPDSVAGH